MNLLLWLNPASNFVKHAFQQEKLLEASHLYAGDVIDYNQPKVRAEMITLLKASVGISTIHKAFWKELCHSLSKNPKTQIIIPFKKAV